MLLKISDPQMLLKLTHKRYSKLLKISFKLTHKRYSNWLTQVTQISRPFIIIIIIIIVIVIIIISLLSGLMLFAGKKCHNSGHRPVVSGIVASFCFFSFFLFLVISYPILFVLFSPFQVNKTSVMLQSSSPNQIFLSISQSAFLLFLMPLLLLV